MKILILDDDIDLCTLLRIFFENKGYTVLVANSLKAGLKLLDEQEPSILFIDNCLPDGEGWKTAKTVKYKHPGIHINLMSAKDKSFNELEEYNDTIWEKPITIEQLETYVAFVDK